MSVCDGVWNLVPELSHYDLGEPPDWGHYEVVTRGGVVTFRVKWRKEGQAFEMSYAAPIDGTAVTADFPGLDSFALHEDGNTLISEAFAKGALVSRGIRRVSGDLMSILQENSDGKGGWLKTWQVYRRA